MLSTKHFSFFLSTGLAAACASAAELPREFEGERTNSATGWTGKVALRGLTYSDGKFTGRGDLYFPLDKKGGATPCNRMDDEVFGTFVASSDGFIESLRVTFTYPHGPRCDPVSVTLTRDAGTNQYVGQFATRWTLRALP